MSLTRPCCNKKGPGRESRTQPPDKLFLPEIGVDRTCVGLDVHGRLPAVHDHKVRVGHGAAVEGHRPGTVRAHAIASGQRKALNRPAEAGRFASSEASQTIKLDLTDPGIMR